MTTPPRRTDNSTSSLEETSVEEQPAQNSNKKKPGNAQPSLTTRGKSQTPFERTFNSPSQNPYGEFDDESSEDERPPKEKSSKRDDQQSQAKQPETKPTSSGRKVVVPSLKLSVLSTTAKLTSRTPVSPNSTAALGSHRTLSPRKADNSPSISTTNSTVGVGNNNVSYDKPLPALPLKPTISTSQAPLSSRSTTTPNKNDAGVSATDLTPRSKSILDNALMNGTIVPDDLGYLLVEVQTEGFKKNLSDFTQGKPFMRAGLKVLNFKASNGKVYDSINLIEKFLEPLAEQVFRTPESTKLIKTLQEDYLPLAATMEKAAKSMRPKEMLETELIKNTMDPVIKPFANWVCGENQKLVDSHLPQAWKTLLLGIDDAVIQWAKKCKTNDIKEVKRLRSEALVGFISTRGYMTVWGVPIQNFCAQEEVKSRCLTTYLNSHFSYRADKFIVDIMLNRKDLVGDLFDSQMRNYLKVVDGQKELLGKTPKVNVSGRRELLKSKTLQSSKVVPSRSDMPSNDDSKPLSPRIREKLELEKKRELKQQQSVHERKKVLREFSKAAKLTTVSLEFFKAFQRHVEIEMSDLAFEKFKKDPIAICKKYIKIFYAGVLNQDREKAQKSLLAMLDDLKQEDIAGLAVASEKVKSYVKLDTQKIHITEDRRKKFFGDFIFYANLGNAPKEFRTSFFLHILNLNSEKYLQFEQAPIHICRTYLETYYSADEYTSTDKGKNQASTEKNEINKTLNSVNPDSMKVLKRNLANLNMPTGNSASAVTPSALHLEFPANSLEENEKQTTTFPVLTTGTLPMQDSRMHLNSRVDFNPVQQNEISQEKRKFFLEEFNRHVKFDDDTDPNFLNSFSNHIWMLTTEEYLKFEENPISFCRDYLTSFYSSDKYTSSNKVRGKAFQEKTYINWLLDQVKSESMAAFKKSIANTDAAGLATERIDQTVKEALVIPANPVAKDVESEKNEQSSESGIATESDSDADKASSEKTEES